MKRRYFASTPRGFEDLLAAELATLGATEVRQDAGGVHFAGDLATGYLACLRSRLAERVLLLVHRFKADNSDELYAGVREVLWREHLDLNSSFAVDVTSRHRAFAHTHFAALRVKDAIVDQFRDATGKRPSVDLDNPDLRIRVHAGRDSVDVHFDLAGDALHRRGYRVRQIAAPLRETLAAGILMRAGWPRVQARGGALLDPMCGSGTFLVEAAWMALDVAPGCLRDRFGFLGWRGHDAALFERLRSELAKRRLDRQELLIEGSDADPSAVAAARANVERAGVAGFVRIGQRGIDDIRPPADCRGGLLVTNPPYGVRLAGAETPEQLLAALGTRLKSEFSGWDAAILVEDAGRSGVPGLRAHRSHRLYNGPIRCRLHRYRIHGDTGKADAKPPGGADPGPDHVDVSAFANRLRKNLRTLGRWASRNGISCYRVYDADVPEFAIAVDLYRSDRPWAHVQEYAPPPRIDATLAARRLRAALDSLPEILGVARENIVLKQRRRQRGDSQYQRFDETGEFIVVEEHGCKLLVNLKDRIDTGLYLDHRATRDMIRELAGGRDFLNLFAYTGVASVQAAAGGAASTLSVDMSATYVEWGLRNFSLNGLTEDRHRYVRDDCSRWLDQATERTFDLIFMDPPTFSNSKRMRGTLDIQRDHAGLVGKTMRLLRPGGILLFSTHAKRFRMDTDSLGRFQVDEITGLTIPKDFARRANVHRCWRITHRQG